MIMFPSAPYPYKSVIGIHFHNRMALNSCIWITAFDQLTHINDGILPDDKKIRTIVSGFGNALISIESFIEKGKIIEDFHPDDLKEIFMRSEGRNIE